MKVEKLIELLQKLAKENPGVECVIDCPECGKSSTIKSSSLIVVLE